MLPFSHTFHFTKRNVSKESVRLLRKLRRPRAAKNVGHLYILADQTEQQGKIRFCRGKTQVNCLSFAFSPQPRSQCIPLELDNLIYPLAGQTPSKLIGKRKRKTMNNISYKATIQALKKTTKKTTG